MKRLVLLVLGLVGVNALAPCATGWPQCPPRQVPLYMRSVDEVTPGDLFAEADRVVLGAVRAVEVRRVAEEIPRYPGEWTIGTCITVAPEMSFRGNSLDAEIEIRVIGGALESQGITHQVIASYFGGTPRFQEGQRVLVFLKAVESRPYFRMLLGARSQYIVDGDIVYSAALGRDRSSTPLAALLENLRQLAQGGQQ
jgi:hypothetical protein